MSLKGKIKYLHVSSSLFAIPQHTDFVTYNSPIQRLNDAVVVHDRVVILCIITQNENNIKMLMINIY